MSAGDEDDAELARPERFFGPPVRLLRRKGVLGCVQTEGRRRRGPRGQLPDVVLLGARLVEPPNQAEIDGLDLFGQRSASCIVQLVPKGQQVFLAVGAENGLELIFHRECRLFAIRAVDAHFMTGR